MNKEKQAELLLGKILKGSKFENKAFSVGGFVRDEVMGIESKDLDIVVEMEGGAKAITEFIANLLKGKTTQPHNLGNGYPIWALTFTDDVEDFKVKGVVLEFADTQKESFPDLESRQRVTVFGSLTEDVLRRDFTCNMLLRNITTGELLDLSNGVKDIEDGFLRSHRDVDFNEILSQDPLRIMRFVRFKAKYNFKVDDADLECIRANAHRIDIISIERVREELVKLMEIGKLFEGVHFMDEIGILERILPEVSGMKNVFHDLNAPFHKEADGEIFGHVMLVLKNAKKGVIPQLSALLHDIGKPPARKVNENGKVSFKHHEPIGGDMTKILMKRLKFDNKTSEVVEKLVRMHTRPHAFGKWNGDAKQPSDKALRKLIRDAGDELDLLLDLSEADSLGNDPVKNTVPALRERIKSVMASSDRPINSKPFLSGSDIMKLRGMTKGSSVIKDIMSGIQDLEDDNGSITLEQATEFAINFNGDV